MVLIPKSIMNSSKYHILLLHSFFVKPKVSIIHFYIFLYFIIKHQIYKTLHLIHIIMRVKELQNIISGESGDNFHNNLENYLLNEIRNKNPTYYNPFVQNEITLKMVISTLLECTIILATLMYLFHNNK